MTDTVIVWFEGDGSGVAELIWGQHEIWCVTRDKSDSLPIGGVRALPTGQTVADVAAGLRFIRLRPGLGGSVSTLAQSCPCLIEVGDARFEEGCVRAWHSALMAYKHAYYDPVAKHEVSGDVATPAEPSSLRDELTRSTLTWGERNDVRAEKVFMYIDDTPDALCYELRADSHFVSPADMAALMRRIEAVLVDAAVGDTAFEGAALGDSAEGGTGSVPAMGAVR